MPNHEQALVAAARRVARVQANIRALRRSLRVQAAELKTAKKQLRILVSSARDPMDQAPPLRMFGERSGME